jgi:hypothetical protein
MGRKVLPPYNGRGEAGFGKRDGEAVVERRGRIARCLRWQGDEAIDESFLGADRWRWFAATMLAIVLEYSLEKIRGQVRRAAALKWRSMLRHFKFRTVRRDDDVTRFTEGYF